MKKILAFLVLVTLPGLAGAKDYLKTIYNSQLNGPDFINNISSYSVGSFVDVSTVGAISGDCMGYNGTRWIPVACGGGGYALEPATVTPNFALGYTAATGSVTGLFTVGDPTNSSYHSLQFDPNAGALNWYGSAPTAWGTQFIRAGQGEEGTHAKIMLPTGKYYDIYLSSSDVANALKRFSLSENGLTIFYDQYGVAIATITEAGVLTGSGFSVASGTATVINSTSVTAGTFTGSGSGLTNIPAASIAAGSLGASVRVSSFTQTPGVAGSYTLTSLTVDADGRVTAASNGTAGGGTGITPCYAMMHTTGTLTTTLNVEKTIRLSSANYSYGITIDTTAYTMTISTSGTFLCCYVGIAQGIASNIYNELAIRFGGAFSHGYKFQSQPASASYPVGLGGCFMQQLPTGTVIDASITAGGTITLFGDTTNAWSAQYLMVTKVGEVN